MCANYVTSANHLNYANCTNCSTTTKLQLLQTCKNATYLTDTCVNCVNEGLFGVGLESSWGWPEFITGSRWLSNLLGGGAGQFKLDNKCWGTKGLWIGKEGVSKQKMDDLKETWVASSSSSSPCAQWPRVDLSPLSMLRSAAVNEAMSLVSTKSRHNLNHPRRKLSVFSWACFERSGWWPPDIFMEFRNWVGKSLVEDNSKQSRDRRRPARQQC